MNPGGIRDDLLFNEISGGEAPGEVTYREAFSVQPFGNSLVTMTLTGALIHELLEEQWAGQTLPRILQPSAGFTYTWDMSEPDGARVVPGTVKLDGGAIADNEGTDYRVTVNSFLTDGGDKLLHPDRRNRSTRRGDRPRRPGDLLG